MFNNILLSGRGESFISFANSDSKRWIVPVHNMHTAMNLYQPSGIKGKLIKHLLPYVYRLPVVKRVVGFEQISLSLDNEIDTLIKSIFKVSVFEFSVFGGTPSVHQKTTIQISNGNTILGYCKLTDNEDIKNIFRHEQAILNSLHKHDITQIPKCLYCGQAIENIYLFVQTTIKSNRSKVLHRFTAKHWDFLSKLHNNTKKNIAFEDSDFCKSLISLRGYIGDMSAAHSEILTKALDKVEQAYKNKIVCFSVYQGDFTPWNIFSERGELFVFDFEYAKMTFPPYMDWFHYFTQTSVFEKHLDVDGIYERYKSERGTLSSYFKYTDLAYLCYLLSIIELYIGREHGEINDEIALKIQRWTQLINLIMKQ